MEVYLNGAGEVACGPLAPDDPAADGRCLIYGARTARMLYPNFAPLSILPAGSGRGKEERGGRESNLPL
jgi:hypothetical protein